MKPVFCALVVASSTLWSSLLQAQPLPERRTLSGRITKSDGSPLPGVSISVQRDSDVGTFAFWGTVVVTDSNGVFRIPDSEEGAYLLSAEVPGFAPIQNRAMQLDEKTSTWNVQLDRLVDLPLRILGADGQALKNTRVVVRLTRQDLVGQPLPRPTDTKGELTLRGQTPGIYSIEVSAPGFGFAQLEDIKLAWSTAPLVREIRLQRGATLKVRARETGPDGRALGGAALLLGLAPETTDEERNRASLSNRSMNLQRLYSSSNDGSRAVTRDGEGSLELLDVAPGRYQARVVLPGYAPAQLQTIELQAGKPTDLTFVLQPRLVPTALKIQLQDKNGKPVQGDWTVQLRMVAPEASVAVANPVVAPNAIAPPPPGIEAHADLGVDDVVLGGLDIEGIDNFPGVAARRVSSDAEGRFTLYPLRPGQWRVVVLSAPENNDPNAERSTRKPSVAQQQVRAANNAPEAIIKFK